MDLELKKKQSDRKYPGVVNFRGLIFECGLLACGSLGFSYRTYQFAKTNRNPIFPSIVSTACLVVLMIKANYLTDLMIHQQKYPELYP